MQKRIRIIIKILIALIVALFVFTGIYYISYGRWPEFLTPTQENSRSKSPDWEKPGKYWETHQYHTPNVQEGRNEVKAIVLHHTASMGTGESVAQTLCRPRHAVSCHVVIDKDGTRYVIADPEEISKHAGYSKLGDRYRVNRFSIGIEFHGNTCEYPLTDEQIESAIEYLRPIIKKYKIPAKNIVTHEMIRTAYMKAKPNNKEVYGKVDITQKEYERVLAALDTAKLLRK